MNWWFLSTMSAAAQRKLRPAINATFPAIGLLDDCAPDRAIAPHCRRSHESGRHRRISRLQTDIPKPGVCSRFVWRRRTGTAQAAGNLIKDRVCQWARCGSLLNWTSHPSGEYPRLGLVLCKRRFEFCFCGQSMRSGASQFLEHMCEVCFSEGFC